ncbi:TPA: hypothetical protein N0F65_004918 [Lagenidium giganteum]|uniref:sn-1-specific diacylglycerol lipase n=1 Tax=Lagenidium giganteum TaxID=4803 RepID=A0AAV2YYY4_9STRA|nr:TPA: hypothetical protein N0F65_004918 [Lagenidium giganteum]
MAGVFKRIVLNPRAYLTPLMLVIIFHHLPMILAYALIRKPANTNACRPLRDLFGWMDVSLGLHVAATVISIVNIVTTLSLNVYRVRRPENWMILALFLLYVANLAWAIDGESLPGDTSSCANDSDEMQDRADSISYFQHFDLVFSAVVLSLTMCTSFMCGVHTSEDIVEAETRWQKRCTAMFRACTCKTYQARDQDDEIFQSLGMILGKFFVVQYSNKKYEGLQFNDLMFCLRLVGKQQRYERAFLQEAEASVETENIPPPPTLQRLETVVESSTLADLAFFGRLAIGIYGWPVYVWYSPLHWFKVFGCTKKPAEHQVIDHDNAVAGNRASFINYTGIQDNDLVYLNCFNFVFQAPYSIVKDSKRKQLIISVRGSLSFYDFVTDGLAKIVDMDPEELPEGIPNPESTRTHYGMLRTARSLFADLQEGSRKAIFWDFAMQHCIDGDWEIVVCGHSMGAGVGGILAMLLKKPFPSTKAFLYAPPMLIDPVTAAWTKSFVTTAVYGDDLVPRLSLANVARLREEMATQFHAAANKPLYRVRYGSHSKQMKKQVEQQLSGHLDTSVASSDSGNPTVQSNSQPTGDLDLNFLRMRPVEETDEVDVPGLIVHMQTVEKARLCGCTMILGEQELHYSVREASYFRRIWVTPRAVSDHMVHHYDRNIGHLMKCLGVEPPNASKATQWVHDADESTPYRQMQEGAIA